MFTCPDHIARINKLKLVGKSDNFLLQNIYSNTSINIDLKKTTFLDDQTLNLVWPEGHGNHEHVDRDFDWFLP